MSRIPDSICRLSKKQLRHLCCGCGLCVAVCPANCLELREMSEGHYQPVCLNESQCVSCSKCTMICPGIRQEEHYSLDLPKAIVYGHSQDSELRWKAASGGVTTELLIYLLQQKLVDYVVTSGRYSAGKKPQPVIVNTPEQLKSVAGSNYCPVPMGLAIRKIMAQEGNCVLVCLPCAARGIRRLMQRDSMLAERISFIITLLCNHKPSFHATAFLAREYLGSRDISEIAEIRYRGEGWFGQATITLRNGLSAQIPFSQYFSTSFSSCYYRPRCQMCLDHFGANADIAMGDADFVKYRGKGENAGETICFVHNEKILQVLRIMEHRNRISLSQDILEEDLMSIYGPLFAGGKAMIAARRAMHGIAPWDKKTTLYSDSIKLRDMIRLNVKFYEKMSGSNATSCLFRIGKSMRKSGRRAWGLARHIAHTGTQLLKLLSMVNMPRKSSFFPTFAKAKQWIRANNHPSGGIRVHYLSDNAYPEVTGYYVPTLMDWGEHRLAVNFVKWLVSIQNVDGSWSDPSGKTPYTFDTGQVIRGFVSALHDLPEVEEPLRKACDWVLAQVQPDGRLATSSTEMWGDIANDSIHLYVLPPLIEAGEKLNEPKYMNAAHRVLEHYKQRKDLVEFKMLSHFHAYVLEALCDLGEIDLARRGMEEMAAFQRPDGSVPAYPDVSWVCSTGVAQLAVVWYKLGMREHGETAVEYLERIQNRSGGFFGSYGKGADYFPHEEISWAVKFFLDACYWRIKTAFNEEADIFADSIDESDGRVQEILSFFGNLNAEKVLDVGCGKGRFLRVLKKKFPQAKLVGLDISEAMLRSCPEGVGKKCGSILDIRYPDAHFDCVYCIETLEHAVRTEAAVREMCRILKPGGKILIIDKNKAKLGRLEIEPWERWFSDREVIKLLKKHKVQARGKLIGYENQQQPDGLFIAWEGVKDKGT